MRWLLFYRHTFFLFFTFFPFDCFSSQDTLIETNKQWDIIEENPIDLACWMNNLSTRIGHRRLRDIFIPGAHDAATSKISVTSKIIGDDLPPALNNLKAVFGLGFGVNAVIKKWSRAQTKTISELLEIGVRYFDIRIAPRDISINPLKKEMEFWTFHGLSGEKFQDVLLQIKKFLTTPKHQKEILVLDLHNVVGGVTHDLYNLIINTLGEACLGTSRDLDKSLNEIWKTNVRIFVVSEDAQNKINSDKILSRETNLESQWHNAQTHEKLFEQMDSYVKAFSVGTKRRILVLQCVLTPDDKIVMDALKPGANGPKSLRDLTNESFFEKLASRMDLYRIRTMGAIFMIDFVDLGMAHEIVQLNNKTFV